MERDYPLAVDLCHVRMQKGRRLFGQQLSQLSLAGFQTTNLVVVLLAILMGIRFRNAKIRRVRV